MSLPTNPTATARALFDALDADIRCRAGLKHEWAAIAPDVMENDLRADWEVIFNQALAAARAEGAEAVRAQAAEMEYAIVDILKPIMGDQPITVVQGVQQLAEAYRIKEAGWLAIKAEYDRLAASYGFTRDKLEAAESRQREAQARLAEYQRREEATGLGVDRLRDRVATLTAALTQIEAHAAQAEERVKRLEASLDVEQATNALEDMGNECIQLAQDRDRAVAAAKAAVEAANDARARAEARAAQLEQERDEARRSSDQFQQSDGIHVQTIADLTAENARLRAALKQIAVSAYYPDNAATFAQKVLDETAPRREDDLPPWLGGPKD